MNLQTKATQGKKYIPWNTLWAELCKIHPEATFEFHCDKELGYPYFNSPLGIFVKVSVTINELTHTMTRPVYNNAFKAMKIEPYEYTLANGTIKNVVGANSADVNDAQMRCFAKAIAMHGLGLFVFEDKPFADTELISSTQISEISKKISDSNLTLSEMFVAFGINKLSELAEFNYNNALDLLEDTVSSGMSISNYIKSIQVKK